jgi:hypothetical protein
MFGDVFGPFQATTQFDGLLEYLANLSGAEVKLFGQGNFFIPLQETTLAERTEVQGLQQKRRGCRTRGPCRLLGFGIDLGLLILADAIHQRAGF